MLLSVLYLPTRRDACARSISVASDVSSRFSINSRGNKLALNWRITGLQLRSSVFFFLRDLVPSISVSNRIRDFPDLRTDAMRALRRGALNVRNRGGNIVTGASRALREISNRAQRALDRHSSAGEIHFTCTPIDNHRAGLSTFLARAAGVLIRSGRQSIETA